MILMSPLPELTINNKLPWSDLRSNPTSDTHQLRDFRHTPAPIHVLWFSHANGLNERFYSKPPLQSPAQSYDSLNVGFQSSTHFKCTKNQNQDAQILSLQYRHLQTYIPPSSKPDTMILPSTHPPGTKFLTSGPRFKGLMLLG